MDLANLLYDFFGFDLLLDSATFPELISYLMLIFCGIWVTVFVIRCFFLATTFGSRRFM